MKTWRPTGSRRRNSEWSREISSMRRKSRTLRYECYDIAVANILADVIIMIQKEVPVHLKQGGIFITSGIIDMKEQAVRDALSQNDAFEILETTRQGEWVSITARKR